MQRKINLVPGEFYHIYNRGNDKRKIFLDDSDYRRFIKLLFFCNSELPVNLRELPKGVTFGNYKRGETLVDIGAYCLMPNHFHLLLHEKKDNGITIFMRKLCTAYSMYFNLKNERRGKLFEGAFLSQHADSDEYLKYLFAYIHLNPVKLIEPKWKEVGITLKSKVKEFLYKYEFSSYRDYLETNRGEGRILFKESFPNYFDSKEKFEEDISDWLAWGKKQEPKGDTFGV